MAERRRLRDWVLAAEAAFWLLVAGVALRTLAFSRLAGLAARLSGWRRGGEAEATAAEAVGRAVEAAAHRAPWPVLCFEKGLAAHAMLRLRGGRSILYYGGRNDASEGLIAHVWVKMGGFSVVGGDQAARFGVLAVFPPP